ncbi:MAG: hypothetical protein A2X35_02110 [Elusimicrobia bacterium GWA2_61_42]|nr:MAG: hypothetical protein A2X35_02110 [Elusimicrobia bacterium GWA2_61_42]OGR79849.1 MAG: hypothetical protein A2X38_12125 [Elusimicrobia bacterium GWC2_61_25]
MHEFFFYIATLDQTVLAHWSNAFRKEGWKTAAITAPGASRANKCHAELDLIEVGNQLCRTPHDLREIIQTRRPAATLAFSHRQKISDSQVVKFLESGADDFVFSNMDERVVVAKLKAYIRRLQPAISAAALKLESSQGEIMIDRCMRSVKIQVLPGKYTELTNLTQKEMAILALLVGNEKRPVSRESMLERLWGEDATEVYSNCINKHIETLRRKLGPYGKRIKTIYGSGYMYS